MKLSIIIVNFNTKTLLKNCLSSIFKSLKEEKGLTWEIIVVDNGSSDGTIEKIKNQISKIKTTNQKLKLKLIQNKENLGFAKANNQAIRQAKGEYILLLNSDAEVLGRGAGELVEFMENHREADIVGGKLFNRDLTPQSSCGPFYSLPVAFLTLFLKGDKLGLTRYSPDKIKEVDWVSGACLLVKKEVFDKIGLFDENIFMYMDEIDFLYRARKIGFKVFFDPLARFIHLGAGSSQDMSRPVVNIYKGLIYFYQKHGSKCHLVILKTMLKIKALAGIFLGQLLGNTYLKETYEEAYKLVR